VTGMLEVELTVTPTRVSNDTVLDIRGAVRNVAQSEVDTEVWASTLLVNEEPSETWSWAIANGFRDEREFALAPGERYEFRRTLPSSSLLREPGQHELMLEVRGSRSPGVSIERY
jgi:hypothetical protein